MITLSESVIGQRFLTTVSQYCIDHRKGTQYCICVPENCDIAFVINEELKNKARFVSATALNDKILVVFEK